MTTDEKLDSPFTRREKIKWTVAVALIPWLMWFPLLWIGALIRTWPLLPRQFTGLWLTPTCLEVAYLTCWFTMLIDRPRVMRERLHKSGFHGDKPEEPKTEQQAQIILSILGLAILGVSTYDAAAMAKNPVSTYVYATGCILVLVSLWLVAWVLRENAFAAKVVYKQEGQVIVTTGPYSLVRHPFYAFFVFFLLGLPLLIGSYLGLVPGLLCIPTLMWRAYHEEEFLVEEFGYEYEQYRIRVPARMFPGIY